MRANIGGAGKITIPIVHKCVNTKRVWKEHNFSRLS